MSDDDFIAAENTFRDALVYFQKEGEAFGVDVGSRIADSLFENDIEVPA